MIPNNRVFAHFLDGRVIKGTTSNFFPNRPTFHLLAVGAGQDTEVQCRILEAGDFGRISDGAPLLKITVLENLAGDMANRLRGANQWIAALA